MALTKVRRGGTDTGISDSSDATAITINSSEQVGIGTTSPDGALHVKGISDHGRVVLESGGTSGSDNNMFMQFHNGGGTEIAQIEVAEGASNEGQIAFKTGGTTTAMTLFNNGYCSIGEGAATSTNGLYVKVNKTSWGMTFHNDGNSTNREGLNVLCGTDNASGTSLAFGTYDGDGSSQGFISFSGGTVTYGAFTAHHPCILPNSDNDPNSKENAYPYGTLLETTSVQYTQKNSANTERGIRYNVRKTQSANSKSILGAYGSSMNGTPQEIGDGTDNTPTVLATNEHQALILGDGHILCNNQGGNIAIGDGICSSDAEGIGMKATANPSMIIGIAQENVTFSGSETKLVAVQYGLQQFIPWS